MAGAPHVRTRRATADDAATVLELVRGLAEEQGDGEHVTVSTERLGELLADPAVVVLLAVGPHGPLGFVSAVRKVHLWSGREVLALDDLFVRPECRDGGIGELLMREIARLVAPERLVIRWEVDDHNLGAQRFYARLGARLSPRVVASWSPESYVEHLAGRDHTIVLPPLNAVEDRVLSRFWSSTAAPSPGAVGGGCCKNTSRDPRRNPQQGA
jgi:ribosomal protein S18 acetylase RimI-like enzyme